MRKQSRARKASLDGAAGRWSLHDAVAARAGEPRTTVADDPEVRTHVFELLSNVLAQRLERAATLRTVGRGQMNALVAFEMRRQRLVNRRFARRPCFAGCRRGGSTLVGQQVFELQFELLDLAIELL